ncbi:hypothetical protein RB195_019538 [Necator americanus]|uniref:Uncharacterized protein n=1 Tax=Necator americanus TaxID=51031 RepID=A0ABR1CFI8_NECAM
MLHWHLLPTAEDIFARHSRKTIFSYIVFASAYLQFEDDDDVKKLLAINTNRGPYKCNQQPFGSAPGSFQQIVESKISGPNTFKRIAEHK